MHVPHKNKNPEFLLFFHMILCWHSKENVTHIKIKSWCQDKDHTVIRPKVFFKKRTHVGKGSTFKQGPFVKPFSFKWSSSKRGSIHWKTITSAVSRERGWKIDTHYQHKCNSSDNIWRQHSPTSTPELEVIRRGCCSAPAAGRSHPASATPYARPPARRTLRSQVHPEL